MRINKQEYKKRILKESQEPEVYKINLEKFSNKKQIYSFKEKFMIALNRFENY